MINSLATLLNKKQFKNTDETIIVDILGEFKLNISPSMVIFTKGIISFTRIPSPLRMEILLKKEQIIEQCTNRGLYVRDIL